MFAHSENSSRILTGKVIVKWGLKPTRIDRRVAGRRPGYQKRMR